MRIKSLGPWSAAVTLLATAAIAQAEPQQAASATTSESSDNGAKVKKVCRTEFATGSRLGGKRVCMTKQEWDQQSEDAGALGKDMAASRTLYQDNDGRQGNMPK
jgi:hypothetical protein